MTDHLEQLTAAIAGRYAIQREVGRGATSTVYVAEDLRHHRRVAVKVLNPELAAAIGADRFLHEIDIAAGLQHPHILPLHDSGDADGMLYYVMPYVEGESLLHRLQREGQLPIDEALGIAREVADALSYAHGRGVVHRDVKPGNIMLASNHAMLTDFGVALIAHAVASDQRLTGTGFSPGTPAYMSPEQAAGDAHIDGRSDVYALGCVLFEMLCGDPPFTGSSSRIVLARKLTDAVPGVRVVRDTVPEFVEQLVLKALARTPADRFRSAGELAQALEAATLRQPHPRFEIAGADGVGDGGPAAETAQAPRGRVAPARSPTTSPPTRWLSIGAGIAALLTAIGFTTTIVYDVVMGIPSEYTPSRMNFPLLGVRAIIPALFYVLLLLVGFIAIRHLFRLLRFGARRVKPLRNAHDTLLRRTSEVRRYLSSELEPSTIADLYLAGSVTICLLAFAVFGIGLTGSFSAFWDVGTSAPDTSSLSCAFRSVHWSYTFVMTGLITALALTWRSTLSYLRRRRASGRAVMSAKWGGMASLIVLVLLTTAPWRLLWDNDRPRALWNGERVYILLERGADVVLYNPARRETRHHRLDESAPLERRNTFGYVFENETSFAQERTGCM